ncbi:MAG: metal ABC transporter substrate-binding protein [Pseudanabaenaceae cyanobacterium bins.68]|nr:metal ABC transporter substrate-binding protein [Pseudanabaenaceae cyanobacterium bins.68]
MANWIKYGSFAVAAIALSSCSSIAPEASRPVSERPKVLTTFTVLADMTKNVAGDRWQVESIPKLGAEIHSYQVTPQDLVRGQQAQLIFENGLNLEKWAARFYTSLPQVTQVTLSQGVKAINIAEDAYRGKPNPHAWMSPRNALIYVQNIQRALSQADPDHASIYAANAQAYSERIKELDQKLRQAIAQVPAAKRYLVTCEGAFSYLAADYGLKEAYLWAVNAEQQATPQQVQRVIQLVKQQQIPAVFCESTVSNQVQLQVAKAANSKYGGTFYVDSLSREDGPAATYLQLLEHNVNLLIQGLTASG